MKTLRFASFLVPLASVLAAAGCTEPNEMASSCAGVAFERPMLLLESDRATSSALATIGRDGCMRETADVSLGEDPALSMSAGRAFVNVRGQGVVLEVDPETALIKQSMAVFQENEPQPNPWDTAVDASGRLWVARYNLASAAIISPDKSWASVDLSGLADDDGAPEMEAVTVVNGRAYIAVERLLAEGDHWMPTGPGVVAVASAEPPFALQTPINLAGSNPFGRLVPDESDPTGDTVTVVTPGDFDAIDSAGGVERIHLGAGTSEVIATEAALGGSPIEAVVASPTEAYAIVAGPVPEANPTSVVRFDPSTGKVVKTLVGPADAFVHSGLALNGPDVVVGDRSYGAPAIYVFARETGERRATIVPKVLPPLSIVSMSTSEP